MYLQEDGGCCFGCRLFITTVMHLAFFGFLAGIVVDLILEMGLLIVFASLLGVAYFFLFLESLCANDLRYVIDSFFYIWGLTQQNIIIRVKTFIIIYNKINPKDGIKSWPGFCMFSSRNCC